MVGGILEQTFFMIKPDGMERGLAGQVLTRIENRGFRLVRLELRQADSKVLRQHYAQLVDLPFFPALESYMISGPLLVGVIEGNQVIESWRRMMGATKPEEALPGTIRGDFSQAAGSDETIRNIVHGSDSQESAEREIALWFGQD